MAFLKIVFVHASGVSGVFLKKLWSAPARPARAYEQIHRKFKNDHLRALASNRLRALSLHLRAPARYQGKSAQVRAGARRWFDHLRVRKPLVSAQVAQVFSLFFSRKSYFFI